MFENAVDLWNSNITRLVLVEQSWSPEAMSDQLGTFKKSSYNDTMLIKQLPIERKMMDDGRTHPKHVPRDLKKSMK